MPSVYVNVKGSPTGVVITVPGLGALKNREETEVSESKYDRFLSRNEQLRANVKDGVLELHPRESNSNSTPYTEVPPVDSETFTLTTDEQVKEHDSD